jgi:hypothetical protein
MNQTAGSVDYPISMPDKQSAAFIDSHDFA